jgi:hypothetical protein
VGPAVQGPRFGPVTESRSTPGGLCGGRLVGRWRRRRDRLSGPAQGMLMKTAVVRLIAWVLEGPSVRSGPDSESGLRSYWPQARLALRGGWRMQQWVGARRACGRTCVPEGMARRGAPRSPGVRAGSLGFESGPCVAGPVIKCQ